MTFEYLKEIKFQDTIDVEDIGNVVLEALNDEGDQWYLSIETEMGYTTIITCGPLTADSNEVGQYFNFNFCKIEYAEKKLCQTINKFISDDGKKITQIFFSSKNELNNRLRDLQEFQINYG